MHPKEAGVHKKTTGKIGVENETLGGNRGLQTQARTGQVKSLAAGLFRLIMYVRHFPIILVCTQHKQARSQVKSGVSNGNPKPVQEPSSKSAVSLKFVALGFVQP